MLLEQIENETKKRSNNYMDLSCGIVYDNELDSISIKKHVLSSEFSLTFFLFKINRFSLKELKCSEI